MAHRARKVARRIRDPDPCSPDEARAEPGLVLLRFDTGKNQWHGRDPATVANHIVKLALVIRWTRRHVLLHTLHRQNLDANVDLIANIERQVLYKKVIRNKRVLAKLDLNRHSILDEIGLVVTVDSRQSRSLDLCFLFGRGFVKRLP